MRRSAWSGGDVLICAAVAVEPVRAVEGNPELVSWLAEQAGLADLTMASVFYPDPWVLN